MSAPTSNGGLLPPREHQLQQPLRSALKSDDDGERSSPANASLKAVSIAEPEPEIQLDDDNQPPKQYSAGVRRRLSGKLPSSQIPNNSSRSSLSESSSSARPPVVDDTTPSTSQTSQHSNRGQYYSEKFLAQVGDWLDHERRKAAQRKKKPAGRKSKSPPKEQKEKPGQDHDQDQNQTTQEQDAATPNGRPRADSVDSQSSDVSFDRLQRILEESMAHMGLSHVPHFSPRISRSRHRKVPSRTALQRVASSDTEYADGDAVVPGCDAWLDNSKTMSYSGGVAGAEEFVSGTGSKADKEREAWLSFKNEIIRIAHTLRLKGWRRVPLGSGNTISVERLSGALTNAVYVVSPPADIPDVEGKRKPKKILLRVYGPQADNLIDRENELQVLRRLARKKIGPRLLGTFKNGRFEQYFNAITLTPADLREPDVMKQIAKRMRELHDGIELLPHERESGPGVWKSWDQWLDNVERIANFLDKQYEISKQEAHPDYPPTSIVHAWKNHGYVCGTPFAQFRQMVEKYRVHLEGYYKGPADIKDHLVFGHCDAQYGNILRIRPDDEKSPLLQPANKHKQLVVIDFEYAGPNTRGVEFANHFTEWNYNYHDPNASWACNERRYPTPDEQRLFLKAYVDHHPTYLSAGASTPRLVPDSGNPSGNTTPLGGPMTPASTSSIQDFMLDARAPPGGWTAAERAHDEERDQEIKKLIEETRLWRPGNSVFWISWGIVQSKVPGLDANSPKEEDIGPEEFDYLQYSQERAWFFWGDCVKMGLIKIEDLPEDLRGRLKMIDY